MNTTKQVHACLIVDDVPIAAAYWMRVQHLALGYLPTETGWGNRWRELAPSSFFRVSDLCEFADFVEEHGIRGKFTLLPCPAGLGRLDQHVRGISDADLAEFLETVRTRLTPRFDITPEVLSHTMAIQPETGAMLPHTEIAWLSHLASSGQMDAMQDYLRHAWTILRNVGIHPHGLTLGGMDDKSGIAHGKMANQGHYCREIAEALIKTEMEFNPSTRRSFLFGPFSLRKERDEGRYFPDVLLETQSGARVYRMFAVPEDPAFPLLHGDGDLARAVDALVSPDLSKGLWIDAAEQEGAVVIVTHAQTLNARNTRRGLQMFRQGIYRLEQRYGRRLIWHTADELCQIEA